MGQKHGSQGVFHFGGLGSVEVRHGSLGVLWQVRVSQGVSMLGLLWYGKAVMVSFVKACLVEEGSGKAVVAR